MKKMCPEDISLLATSIAIDLAKNKSCEEINLLITLSNQIISVFCTIIAQKKFLEDNCHDKPKYH